MEKHNTSSCVSPLVLALAEVCVLMASMSTRVSATMTIRDRTANIASNRATPNPVSMVPSVLMWTTEKGLGVTAPLALLGIDVR